MDHPHLRVLRCPVTGQELRPASDAELAALRRATSTEVSTAIATVDGRIVYPVQDGIYALLIDAAFRPGGEPQTEALSQAKNNVRGFYDTVGWTRGDDDRYVDEDLFEDTREVSSWYREMCNRRIKDSISATGRYLLDAASGPVQYADYLTFSEGYDVRVCLDFSLTALRQAQRKLGDHGLYVLGDMTKMPLADGSMDGVVSLHTIYHVPAEEQARAFQEIHRVLAPAGSAAIVYSWGRSVSMKLLHVPLRVRAARRGKGAASPLEGPDLYFAPHSHRWFVRQPWPFRYEITCWRSPSVPVLRGYVPDSARGADALRRLFALEGRFPRLAGRFGCYPLIKIYKDRTPKGA